jgi:hypothetical protein
MGSSSSKQSNTMPQGQTITQTGLPSYFQPYVMDVLQRGQEASYQPYTPYKDQRIAGFTPGQIQAQEGVLGLQTPGQFGTATQFATQAGQMGLGAASQYMPGQFTTPQVNPNMVRAPKMNAAQTGFAPNLQAFEMAGPERVAAERATTGSFLQPGMASQYMSPYMQNVVDVQKQAAIEDAQKAQLGVNLGAARQGTYGGARQLLAQTEREKALGQQLGQIQATGSQAAYDAAQRQFEAEQGRGLQAQQLNVQSQLQAQLANQQAMQQKAQQDLASRLGVQELGTQTGLQTALANLSSQQQSNVQNLAAKLQTQGLNSEQALRAALANQQSSLEAQRLQEQSRQYGAGLGLQGAGMGLEAARTLGGLGGAQQQAELQRLGAISGAGAEQQALTQQQMDLAYQDFLRQQQYPMSQLQQYAGLLSGLPSPGSTQVASTYSQPASLASQLIGLGTAGYGAYKTFGSAKGGEIKGYNTGGLVAFAGGGDTPKPYTVPQSPMGLAQTYGSKQALQQAIQTGVVDPTSGLMAAMLMDKMQAPNPQPPQGTVAQQVFSGLGTMPPQAQTSQPPMPQQAGLNAPEFTAADGGVVGYAGGGGVASFSGREGSEVRSLEELKRLHRQALASGDRASANVLQAEINRLSPSSRRSLYDTSKRDVDYSLFTKIPKAVVTPREIPLSGVLEKLGYDSESMVNPSLTYDPIRGVKTMGRGIGAAFESAAQPRTLGPISYDPSIIGRGAVAAYNKIFDPNADFDPNAPAPASAPPPATQTPSARAPSAGLGALAPADMTAIPAKREIPVDYMAKAKELFAGVPSGAMTDEELAKDKEQRKYEALMQFGLNLAGTKNPSFLGGVGEAGAATMPLISEARKAQTEEEATRRKEDRDTQLQIISTALGIEQQEADRALKTEANDIARAEMEARANAPKFESEFLVQLMKNDPDSFNRLNDGKGLTQTQVMRGALELSMADPNFIQMTHAEKIGTLQGFMDYLSSIGQSAGSGAAGVSVTAPDGTTHTFPTQEAADQFKKAIGIK